MALEHPALVKLLQLAYSAEKAAAFAYVGHAGSVRNPEEKTAIRQIELDEWGHREAVLAIMRQHNIPVSRYNEIKYHIIGKIISFSCYVIGWFMPYYFAGRLESGNVCEYFVMLKYFHSLGITEHDEVLYQMGIKEKEHEVHFIATIKDASWLPLFEKIFAWGTATSLNDVDLDNPLPVDSAEQYCKDYKSKKSNLPKPE